ncbi:MAG TPA: hydrogenase maturation protease [Gemmatimonadaceae bacterium]|jgi:hydrogenase maturation protease
MSEIWQELRRPAPESVTLGDHTLRAGSRVRLHPRARGDILDQMLAGRSAIVEGLDESLDGVIHVAVTIEEDPGRDLGESRYPGHRFFFALDEIEPLDTAQALRAQARILVAGIGNIFLADDGFGVAVAQRLAALPRRAGVEVRDFGIRGMDLAYAMQKDYDAVVFVDAAPRGEPAGTLSVIDASADLEGPPAIETHGMDPVRVLALARALGRVPARVLVVACEPERIISPEQWDEMDGTMSEAVTRSIPRAVELVHSVIDRLVDELRRDNHAATA